MLVVLYAVIRVKELRAVYGLFFMCFWVFV